jgi:hypothetical protein
MILKPGRFYQTQQNHNLMATDQAAPESRDSRSGKGGKVMGIVNMVNMIMFTKHGRWRYVQVVYKDMIGWIWLPTNIPTHFVFAPVEENQDSMLIDYVKGPFVKPTRPAKPRR